MNPVEQITMCGSVFTTQIGLFASLSVYKLKVCNICVCLNYVCNMCVFVMGNVCVLAGCPPGWFGEDCALLCNCSNGGLCDSVSGSCTCGLGWTGPHCDTGERYCTVSRPMQNPKKWLSHPGDEMGLTAVSLCLSACVIECPPGTFGANCQLKCDCRNNGSCDRLTGTCLCIPGYYGRQCENGE